MKVLILGSGGREHVLAWKIAQSSLLSELFIAPGNGGTGEVATNVILDISNFEEIASWVLDHSIELVVVGPENPLVDGIHDYFLGREDLKAIHIIGPQQEGARLEGSKEFAKEFMMRHNIPTAKYKSFTIENLGEGAAFLRSLSPPYVLKADGLAAGKGVVILDDLDSAIVELDAMIQDSKFGEASTTVVIEEFLDGIELSVFAFSDGNSFITLPTAKDYKRIGEGDTGLNTGGMGAISPVPFADSAYMEKVEQMVVKPTFDGLKEDGIPFQGIVFFGLINVEGDPKVIEYNVRFGDPEAEAVIPRIKSDLLEIFKAMGEGNLHDIDIEIDSATAATVIMVAGGYPESYQKGAPISGNLSNDNSLTFHAGTKVVDGTLVTNGGRVLAITSFGNDIDEALEKTYGTVKDIQFSGCNYRKDIGFDLKTSSAPASS
ncbi:MAG: phosphoribosylamine--glycine ligase [Flavobacteriales bacterium]|nr:phosphoribosylamine--glycine ligase [Flavobacteriales bacterium]